MNGIAELMKEYWALLMSGVFFIVWMVRLESRSLSNEREIKRMGDQRVEDLKNAKESREDTKETLSEMKDSMKVMASDIKTLLSRHN